MPRTRLRHEFTLRAAPDAVAAHLSEPSSYVGLSPLVVEVRDISRGGDVTRYTAVERFSLPFGRQYDNLIDVTLRSDLTDATVLVVGGDVVSPGRVRLAYSYRITGTDEGSRVVDELELSAPFGLLHLAARKAREVQLRRALVLAARLQPDAG